MKLAMISSERLPVPPVKGGAVQTYIDAVATRLAKEHEVTVYGVADPSLPEEEVKSGVRHVRINSEINDQFSFLEGVVEKLSGQSFDVVQVYNRPLFVLPIHRAVPESRIALSLHNEMFRETKIPPNWAKQTLEAVDVVTAVSQYICDTVKIRYPESAAKLNALYAGVDIELFPHRLSSTGKAAADKLRSDLGIGSGPVILYVGRLSEKKGPDVLIDAMPQILNQYPDAVLVLVGSQKFGSNETNPYVRHVWEKAERLGDHVVFTGYVPYKNVYQYFALGDVFVCSSQWEEPLARVHYEAMASGLPIITTNRGGNPEVIQEGENGIIIRDWSESAAFAEAISQVLADPNLARSMGDKGRSIVKNQYTWNHIAAKLDRLLTRAAGQTPKPQPKFEVPMHLMKQGDSPLHLLKNSALADTTEKMRLRTLHSMLLAIPSLADKWKQKDEDTD